MWQPRIGTSRRDRLRPSWCCWLAVAVKSNRDICGSLLLFLSRQKPGQAAGIGLFSSSLLAPSLGPRIFNEAHRSFYLRLGVKLELTLAGHYRTSRNGHLFCLRRVDLSTFPLLWDFLKLDFLDFKSPRVKGTLTLAT